MATKFPHRRYENFNYPQDEDTALTHEQIRARRDMGFFATGAHTLLGTPQYLGVTRTMPESGNTEGRPVIGMPAFTDEAFRPDSPPAFRLAQANALDRPVYTVHAPGVHTWWLSKFQRLREMPAGVTHRRTHEQKEGLRHGSFTEIGAACLNAVYWAEMHFNDHDPDYAPEFDLHGSSMGAAIAIGALKAVAEKYQDDPGSLPFRVTGAALSEIVHIRKDGINRARFAQGFAGLDQTYVGCNPESVRRAEEPGIKWALRTASSPAANLGWRYGYGPALARGDRLESAFGDSRTYAEMGIPMSISWADESLLTDRRNQEEIVSYLRKGGVAVDDYTYKGHDHGATLTDVSVIREVQALEDLQRAA